MFDQAASYPPVLLFHFVVYCVDVNANIAQIVQASGERPAAIPFLITIMSLASCLSRVLVGATAQLFEDAGLPRTLFVLGSVSCMLGSQLCLATATSAGLYIGATLGQFGYGACCTFAYTSVCPLYHFNITLNNVRVTCTSQMPFIQRSSLTSMVWRTW
jgi:MFS family permease